MAVYNKIDEKGNITLRQGDSFELVLNGLPVDQNYKVFFAVQDKERTPIGNEVEVETKGASSVTVFLTAGLTDLLVVEEGAMSQVYYYGVKICSTESPNQRETTLVLGEADNNTITVYPLKVKGV
jgi:hypothetical protein